MMLPPVVPLLSPVKLAASVIRAHFRSAQRLTRNATPPADPAGRDGGSADLQLMKADPPGGLIFSVRERGANSAQQGCTSPQREKPRIPTLGASEMSSIDWRVGEGND